MSVKQAKPAEAYKFYPTNVGLKEKIYHGRKGKVLGQVP